MTDVDTNGQHDQHHHPDAGDKPAEVKQPEQPEQNEEPRRLTLAEQKAEWAREAEERRVALQADIDQLQAEINDIETVAGVQVAEIEAEIKQLRAEIRNIEKIHGLAEKEVHPPGVAPAPVVEPPKGKGKGR